MSPIFGESIRGKQDDCTREPCSVVLQGVRTGYPDHLGESGGRLSAGLEVI